MLALTVAALALFTFLMVVWGACAAFTGWLEDKRAAKTGDFLLEAKR